MRGRWLTPGDGLDGGNGHDDERRVVLTNLQGAGRRKRDHHELGRLPVALLDQLRAVTVMASVDEGGPLVGPPVMMRRHTGAQCHEEREQHEGLEPEQGSRTHREQYREAGRGSQTDGGLDVKTRQVVHRGSGARGMGVATPTSIRRAPRGLEAAPASPS